MDSLSSTSSSDVLVARQPIYDAAMNVVAYELLVQTSDGAAVTSSTITDVGLNLVAGHVAYVKVSREFVLEGYAAALPADRVVLEVDHSIAPDPAVAVALEALVGEGYTLSVENFVHDESLAPLLDIAKVVKLD